MAVDKPEGVAGARLHAGKIDMDRRAFIQWAGAGAMAAGVASHAEAAIRIGYFDKYAPFSQRSDNGVVSGALVDGMELVANACGLQLEHYGYPWARAQLMVERGELDGCPRSVTPKSGPEPASARVPDACRSVRRGRDDPATVRTEGKLEDVDIEILGKQEFAGFVPEQKSAVFVARRQAFAIGAEDWFTSCFLKDEKFLASLRIQHFHCVVV